MKYMFNQIYLIGSFCLLVSCTAMAQKFNTHQVRSGETLESISKMYGVSPASILQYNKEIKEGQKLRSNTILVVPGKKIVEQTSTPASNTPTSSTVTTQ